MILLPHLIVLGSAETVLDMVVRKNKAANNLK
jgi:hypothetical protein